MVRSSPKRQSCLVCRGSAEVSVVKWMRLRILIILVASVALAGSAVFAGVEVEANGSTRGSGDCAREVWQSATDNPWFYNEAGDLVVPQVNYEWLVVHFDQDLSVEETVTGELPPAILRINALFKEQLVDLIYDPDLAPEVCMYRIRNPDSSVLLAAEMARAEAGGLVRSVRPAYTIGDTNFALLDEIEIRWKTQVNEQMKTAILAKAGVTPLTEDAGRKQRVRIDPCRASVWETANLLHEDLHVVSASPVLTKIEPPVRATFTVGMNGATIGAPVPFSLEIRFSTRMRIEPSTIANLDLCPQELSKNLFKAEYNQPLSSVDLTTSPILIEGHLYLFGTGEFVLPEVPVYYKQADNEEAELAMTRTPGIPMRIASVIPESPGRYQLKVAEVQELPEIRAADLGNRKFLALAVSAIGAALLVLCLVGLRCMVTSVGITLPTERAPDVAGKYASTLRGVLSVNDGTLDSAEMAAFGYACRAYLGAKCGVPAESMGGGAGVFYTTLQEHLPMEMRPRVYELLELLETGLSRGQLHQDEVARIFESVRVVLQHYEGNI